MAAGSGGIRWNSETNYIELADENKNWIDWKPYKPGLDVIPIMARFSTSSNTVVCEYNGLYICFIGGYSGTSNATISYNSSGSANGSIISTVQSSDGRGKIAFIYANEGDSISFTHNVSGYSTGHAIFYIQGFTTVIGQINTETGVENGTKSCTSPSGSANCMLVFAESGSTVDNSILSAGDGGISNSVQDSNRYVKGTCAINYNKISMSASMTTRGGGVGNLFCYCTLDN